MRLQWVSRAPLVILSRMLAIENCMYPDIDNACLYGIVWIEGQRLSYLAAFDTRALGCFKRSKGCHSPWLPDQPGSDEPHSVLVHRESYVLASR